MADRKGDLLGENLRLAMDLHDAGVEMMRQNLRRQFPAENPEEIESRLAAWLRARPGAEWGDAEGRLRVMEAPEKPRR